MIKIGHLYKEKSARLEGLYVEKLFRKQILEPAFGDAFSSGWWFVRDGKGYAVIKLCLEEFCLNHVDEELAAVFLASGEVTKMSIVGFDAVNEIFRWKRINNFKDLEKGDLWGQAKILTEGIPSEVHNNANDLVRSKEVVTELYESGYLEEAAIERFFASRCLGGKFAWDSDYYVKYGEKLIGFEVKQKFPIRHSESFGINKGLGQLFSFHERLGIDCYHIILTKPVWDKDFSAIQLLKEKRYSEVTLWIGAKIKADYFQGKAYTSPNHTSLYKMNTLTYYELPVKDFHVIKFFNDPNHQKCLLSFLDGYTIKMRDIKDFPELRTNSGKS